MFALPQLAHAQAKWSLLPETPQLPAADETGFVVRDDARIWYAVFGSGDRTTVTLLHGGGANSDYFGHLVRELSRDYRVLVIDNRGQGRSTNESKTIAYEQMARDVLAVLDRLGIGKTVVVGWSDGANIAFHLALCQPERISALIAFAGNATPAGYQPAGNAAIMAAYATRTRGEYRKLSPHPERHGSLMTALAAMWRTQPRLTRRDLAAIKVRTAIFHAEHDEIIRRAHGEEIAAAIPGAKFVLLRGVSHFALLQDPGAFNRAVRDFLDAR